MDTSDTKIIKLIDRYTVASTKLEQATSFVSPQIDELSDEYLNSLLEDNGTEVNCNFCDKIYNFTTQDIEELIKKCTK